MNLLDILVMTVVIYYAYSGMRQGLIKLGFELAALVGGIYLAVRFFEAGTDLLQARFGMNPAVGGFVSFIGIWAIVYLVFSLLGRFATRFESVEVVMPINAVGGLFLGGVKGFFLTLPVLIPLSHTDLQLYHASRIAKPLNAVASTWVVSPFKSHEPRAIGEKKTDVASSEKIKPIKQTLQSGKEGAAHLLSPIEKWRR